MEDEVLHLLDLFKLVCCLPLLILCDEAESVDNWLERRSWQGQLLLPDLAKCSSSSQEFTSLSIALLISETCWFDSNWLLCRFSLVSLSFDGRFATKPGEESLSSLSQISIWFLCRCCCAKSSSLSLRLRWLCCLGLLSWRKKGLLISVIVTTSWRGHFISFVISK